MARSSMIPASRIASDEDKLAALVFLSSLPFREPMSRAAAKSAYLAAMAGSLKQALSAACQAIMRGSLGHGFMPSPPELAIEIRRMTDEILAPATRERRFQWDEDDRRSQPMDRAAADRATALWQQTKAQLYPPPEPIVTLTDEERLAALRERAAEPVETSPELGKRLRATVRADQTGEGQRAGPDEGS